MRKLDLSTALQALQHRGFRTFWIGRLLVATTVQMRMVARGWLVYSLTESAFALTWVTTAQSLAMLFLAPVAGVLIDRLDKRIVMLSGRLLLVINNAALAAMIISGRAEVWHIAASALLDGITFSFTAPAQNTIVPDLVPRELVMNAFAMMAVGGSIMGIIGAVLAGQLIEWVGAGTVFAMMAVIYLVVGLLYLRLPKIQGHNSHERASVGSDLLAGARYLKGKPVLLMLLGLAFTRMCFVMPYRTLLPAYAADTLGMSASGLGWLTSANLLGALVISLALTAQGDSRGKGRVILLSGMAIGVALLLFVGIRWIPTTFLFIAVAGGANQATMILSNTLMQTRCEAQYRGRVNSLRQTLSGVAPALRLPAGALADQIGVPPVVAVQALLVILIFGGVWLLRPQFRKIK